MPLPAAIRRLPKLRFRPGPPQHLVTEEDKANYPGLLPEDFKYLEEKLMPHFRKFDNEALGHQNQFRLKQLMLIVGGTAAAILGAVQAAYPDEQWPGFAEAALGALLIAVAFTAQQMQDQNSYLTKRLKAELLRGEYFMYLGHVGPYAEEAAREDTLITRVSEISLGKGDN